MDKELRILILEDVPADAELEEHELRKSGLVFTSKVVDTREAFLKELDEFFPDLILSDYDLPSFDGLAALRIAKEKCPDVPFILVTGKLGEEFAIEKLKEGATDYVLKGNLKRLVPSVERALAEAKLITERKRAEEALRQSEERYQKQFKEAIDAIFLADLETGMIVDCNIAASKLVEREKSEIIGKHQSFLHPAGDIKDGVSKTFKSHMTGESSELLEDRVITKSGQIKDVAIRASKITIEGKEVMQGIFRDITECKQTQEALRESEEKYRLLFEGESDAILVFDGPSKTIIDVNTAAQKLYGYSREEFLNMQLKDVAAQPEESEKTFQIALTGKLLQVPLKYHRKKDGTVFPVEISAGTFSLRGQTIVIGAIRDVTEKKQAENDLRESEERYSTMVNFSPNVVLVHKGGTIHYINESGIRILGYLRDEIIGKTVLEFISDNSKELVAKNMQRRISGEHVENYEVKVITKSKDIKYFLVNAAIIPYENEKASLVVLFDITERKQAEEKIGQKMSEMERLKKRFYM